MPSMRPDEMIGPTCALRAHRPCGRESEIRPAFLLIHSTSSSVRTNWPFFLPGRSLIGKGSSLLLPSSLIVAGSTLMAFERSITVITGSIRHLLDFTSASTPLLPDGPIFPFLRFKIQHSLRDGYGHRHAPLLAERARVLPLGDLDGYLHHATSLQASSSVCSITPNPLRTMAA